MEKDKIMTNRRFISFEGIDFTGKSTQIMLLSKWLSGRGHRVHVVREPGGTEISEKIREILLDRKNLAMTAVAEMLLYSAARNQLLNEKIKPALQKEEFVIADRFYDSTSAYQGYGRGISRELINDINRIATEGTEPGTTFFLDLSLEDWKKRKQKIKSEPDRLENAGIEFFKNVREGYLEIARQNPHRFIILDANREIQELEKIIREFVQNRIPLKK